MDRRYGREMDHFDDRLYGEPPGSGRRQRASALQARKNVQSFQHAENMSMAELVASARSASPQRRQAARPPARRPPARKRKQVSSEEEEDSDLDDEEDDYEGGYVRSAVLTRGRRTRHVKTMDADMIDLDELIRSDDEEADLKFEELAAGPRKPPGAAAGRGRGTPRGRGRGRGRGRPKAAAPRPQLPDDVLHGCPKCRYLRNGCSACRGKPAFTRTHNRWKPGDGRPQEGVEAAPTFRPTEEEFKDPFKYLNEVVIPGATPYGMALIVPPPGFDPPFALEKGTNGLSMESFRFSVRTQFTSHLCCRKAAKTPGIDMMGSSRYGCHPAAATTPSAAKAGAGDLTPFDTIKVHEGDTPSPAAAAAPVEGDAATAAGEQQQPKTEEGAAAPAEGAAAAPTTEEGLPAGPAEGVPAEGAAAAAGVEGPTAALPPNGVEPPAAPAAEGAAAEGEEGAAEGEKKEGEFGHGLLDKKLTLRSFAAYSDWAKSVHFADPAPSGAQEDFGATRRPKSLPNQFPTGADPSVEEVEAEFWRIVETPDAVVETLYGQDLDSGHHGSGFPLPEWRRKLLAQHLGKPGAPATLPPYETEVEREYAEHPWNINNMPRSTGSVLRYYPSADLITGVMVPWLYVGSALSAFCWHVEDHALCSINFLHMGSPKVWYAVPPHGTKALEEAMHDALPHLFEATPNLLHQLVTTLSPTELKKRGVPLYRLVHEPGCFVVTMPDGYHAGFNCGFNVAEAVNFGPPAWLPYGYQVVEKYRAAGKAPTLSHDMLLTALVCASEYLPGAEAKEGEAPEPELPPGPLPSKTPFDGDIPWAQVPPEAVRLAAADLSLRAQEERRRRGVAAAAVGALPECRMDLAAGPEARDAATGAYSNTENVDCAHCKCDLFLSAVVSPAAPDVAACPEHAEVLVREHGAAADSLTLLYRYTPEELEGFVARAARRVEGTAETVELARTRAERWEAERARMAPQGPMYDPELAGDARAPGQPGPLPPSHAGSEGEEEPARKRPPPSARKAEELEPEFVEFEEEEEEEPEEEDSEDEYRPSRGARGSGRGRGGGKRGRGRGSGRGRPSSGGRGSPGAKPGPPPGAGRPLAGMVPGMMQGVQRPGIPGMMPGAGLAGAARPAAGLMQPMVVMTPSGPVLMQQPAAQAQIPGVNPALTQAMLAQMFGQAGAGLTPQQKQIQAQQQALLLAQIAAQQQAAQFAAHPQMAAPVMQQHMAAMPAATPAAVAPRTAAPAPMAAAAAPQQPATVAPVLPPAPALAVPPLQASAPQQVAPTLPQVSAPAAAVAPAAAPAAPPATQPAAAPPAGVAPQAPAAAAAAAPAEAPAQPAAEHQTFDVADFLS